MVVTPSLAFTRMMRRRARGPPGPNVTRPGLGRPARSARTPLPVRRPSDETADQDGPQGSGDDRTAGYGDHHGRGGGCPPEPAGEAQRPGRGDVRGPGYRGR